MISFCDGKLYQCDYPFETDIEQIHSVGTKLDYYNDEELDFVQPHKKIEVNLVKFDTPYADTISRQAAIDAMREETCMSCWDAKDILKHLPPASTEKIGRQIKHDTAYECGKHASKWIPVSERLPDIHDYCMKYLVTDCHRNIYTSLFTESSGKSWWSHDNVIAWMPLPEPYKADKEVGE